MKIVYNIKVEKELSGEEELWLVNHNLCSNEALTKEITSNTKEVKAMIEYFDATKLLNFNADIIYDKM